MASFLLVWHRATVDLKMALRRGDGLNRQVDLSRYVVPEQTLRGVGPGYALNTTVTQYHVSGVDEGVPPPSKRAKTEKDDPGYARYCMKVSESKAFRLCEGLLGKFAGLSEPGYMFPWDWTVLHIEDDDGQSIIPGREQFVARGADHRAMTVASVRLPVHRGRIAPRFVAFFAVCFPG
eukprot:56051-Alexandrium_andersonii.AAC.1